MLPAFAQRLKAAVFYLNDCVGVVQYLLHGGRPRPGLTVLCYHRLAKGLPGGAPCNPYNVEPDRFARQVAELAALKRVRLVSLPTVRAWLGGDVPVDGACVLLTFDDGWRNLLPAAQLLAKRRIPAALFVPSAYVGRPFFEFSSFDVWCAKLPNADAEWFTPLTVDECRELPRLGVVVQPHGHAHRSLGNLPPQEMEEDLDRSLAFVRETLHADVLAFVYPFGSSDLGDVTDAVADALHRRGVSLAFTTDAGHNPWPALRARALRLKRIPVNAYDRGLLFRAKASGYCGMLPQLKALWHRLLRTFAGNGAAAA